MGFPIRLRPELSYTRFNIKDLLGTPGSGSPGTSDLLGAMGNIELPLFGGLYVLAGVGAVKLSTDATSGSSSLSQTKFTIDGGAGLRFHLVFIDGFIEGRINSVLTEQGALDFKDVRVIPVTFGLVF